MRTNNEAKNNHRTEAAAAPLLAQKSAPGGLGSSSSTSTPSTSTSSSVASSPFFRPSDPRKRLERTTTPGGTVRLSKKSDVDVEHKSSVAGATCNMVVSIIGAGIVGIPYALKQSGLVAGVIMVVLCAVITEKSLRLLVETAKHVGVPSYETLYEACFGRAGFYAMSCTMFLMSYGAMIGYMIIVKDSLSFLLGIDPADAPLRRAVLTVATVCVLLPISSQRDMADLARTSSFSVAFYILITAFVLVFSPVQATVEARGGWLHALSQDVVRPDTFFTGIGVLSFAYVCQHSAYIIAGSLHKPTKRRWATVTSASLLFCGAIATVMGIAGYLGFTDGCDGNILNNFPAPLRGTGIPVSLEGRLANSARALLCLTMFCVYPMDAFVSRHVLVVLLFKGRRAHEGDDHSVLARTDRRILLTLFMVLVTFVPAAMVDDLGIVLAVTGAVAASFLAYIAPGSAYLATHGDEFLKLVRESRLWGTGTGTGTGSPTSTNALGQVLGAFLWYATFMPVWVAVARHGQSNLEEHLKVEAAKSPLPSRLGECKTSKKMKFVPSKNLLPPRNATATATATTTLTTPPSMDPGKGPGTNCDEDGFLMPVRTNSLPMMGQEGSDSTVLEEGTSTSKYGALAAGVPGGGGGNRAIAAAIARRNTNMKHDEEEDEDDPQGAFPRVWDFVVAILFMSWGVVAMVAGLFSIFAGG